MFFGIYPHVLRSRAINNRPYTRNSNILRRFTGWAWTVAFAFRYYNSNTNFYWQFSIGFAKIGKWKPGRLPQTDVHFEPRLENLNPISEPPGGQTAHFSLRLERTKLTTQSMVDTIVHMPTTTLKVIIYQPPFGKNFPRGLAYTPPFRTRGCQATVMIPSPSTNERIDSSRWVSTKRHYNNHRHVVQ